MGYALVAAGILISLFAVRRYPPVRAAWSKAWGLTRRIEMRPARWLARIVLFAVIGVALWEFSVPIVVGVVFAFLVGAMMPKGLPGTIAGAFVTAVAAVLGLLVVGHLIAPAVVLAFVLELHRNRAQAFARPERPPTSPPPPQAPPTGTRAQ